ncbi:13100_t:CDS:2 [Cetraspora pellucida]|uniref:13100_t:CDS:1 n=1 Tax=Cetraspora pellucida TaxID=1433469 RepID=A0A9N8Z3S8_9GLOM|nr:13100_t:CDS:2 [Cetraspora pellucida]
MDSRPLPPDTTKQPPVSTWDDPRDASQPQSSTQSQGLYPPLQDNQYNPPNFPQPQPQPQTYLSPPPSYSQRPHSYHGETQSYQPQSYPPQPYQSSQSGAPKKKKKNIWDKLGLGKFGSSSSSNPGNNSNFSSANYGNSGKKHNFSSMALGGLGGALHLNDYFSFVISDTKGETPEIYKNSRFSDYVSDNAER